MKHLAVIRQNDPELCEYSSVRIYDENFEIVKRMDWILPMFSVSKYDVSIRQHIERYEDVDIDFSKLSEKEIFSMAREVGSNIRVCISPDIGNGKVIYEFERQLSELEADAYNFRNIDDRKWKAGDVLPFFVILKPIHEEKSIFNEEEFRFRMDGLDEYVGHEQEIIDFLKDVYDNNRRVYVKEVMLKLNSILFPELNIARIDY